MLNEIANDIKNHLSPEHLCIMLYTEEKVPTSEEIKNFLSSEEDLSEFLCELGIIDLKKILRGRGVDLPHPRPRWGLLGQPHELVHIWLQSIEANK